MNAFAADLIALARFFALYEREAVCCGTVTVPQCVALQSLLDGAKDVGSMAAISGVTDGSMTRLIDGLEERAWIRRVRGEDDRRRVAVELTDAGRKEALRLRAMTAGAIERVVSRVPKNKRAQVLESLQLVRQALEAARDEWQGCCAPERESSGLARSR